MPALPTLAVDVADSLPDGSQLAGRASGQRLRGAHAVTPIQQAEP
jgi:hypothetical protein